MSETARGGSWAQVLDAYEAALDQAEQSLGLTDDATAELGWLPDVPQSVGPTPAEQARFDELRARADDVLSRAAQALEGIRAELRNVPQQRRALTGYAQAQAIADRTNPAP